MNDNDFIVSHSRSIICELLYSSTHIMMAGLSLFAHWLREVFKLLYFLLGDRFSVRFQSGQKVVKCNLTRTNLGKKITTNKMHKHCPQTILLQNKLALGSDLFRGYLHNGSLQICVFSILTRNKLIIYGEHGRVFLSINRTSKRHKIFPDSLCWLKKERDEILVPS